MSNEPFFIAYFGKPHSGKTYDLEQFVKKCGRETIFVYNSGWDKDWVGFELIELWSDKKEEQLYFTYKNKDYLFERHFMKKFKGKKVKAMMAKKKLTERLLYEALSNKGYEGLFFIIDDATNILTSRLTQSQKACFFRAKHVGIWFALIFHDPNMFPNGAWGALTIAKFFKNNVSPPTQKSQIIPHFMQVMRAYRQLKSAPKHSYCTLIMDTGQLSYTPFKNNSKTK